MEEVFIIEKTPVKLKYKFPIFRHPVYFCSLHIFDKYHHFEITGLFMETIHSVIFKNIIISLEWRKYLLLSAFIRIFTG